MPIPRPLTKPLLKKMFLKVLFEHKRPGGMFLHNSSGYDSILTSTLLHFFKLTALSQEKHATARRAIFELERNGFIMQDPSQTNDVFKDLTDKGKRVVTMDLAEMTLPSIDIEQLLSRDDLRDKVQDEFLEGDFISAVFKAFKLLEETVRKKAKQPSSKVGVDLMTVAFRPTGGVLQHPEARINTGEPEALHQLMRGAIGWFKNPSSHRTVGYHDEQQVAHTIAFANLLLDLVDQCNGP